MRFLDRKLSIAFSSVTLGAVLLLGGCDEPPDNDNSQSTAPASALSVTPGPTEGMPTVLFLTNGTGAFPQTNPSENVWADRWERQAQPHHAQLMQDPENVSWFQHYLQQFDGVKNGTLQEKIEAVNAAVNSYVTYTTDTELYGRSDYWASPVETLKQRRGDCEDYAILKYYVLKALGVDDNRMFLTAVNMSNNSQAGADHVVLSVNMNENGKGQYFVMLDNNSAQPVDASRSGYSLYSAFNDSGYWRYQADYFAMAAAAPVKTENNGRVVEQDGTLIIDGGRVVLNKDGTVLVNDTVKAPVAVADRQANRTRAPG